MSAKFETVISKDNLELLRLETEPFGTNSYILTCRETGKSILIDAPGDAEKILSRLSESELQYVIITHGHMDHSMALEHIAGKLGKPVAAHEKDASMLPVQTDIFLHDGDRINCGNIELEVIHTPGHTDGSICLFCNGFLLSGDTIFPGGPGKTASPEAFKEIVAGIEKKLLVLPEETLILPGHGASTVVAKEKELFALFKNKPGSDQLCGDVTWNNN